MTWSSAVARFGSPRLGGGQISGYWRVVLPYVPAPCHGKAPFHPTKRSLSVLLPAETATHSSLVQLQSRTDSGSVPDRACSRRTSQQSQICQSRDFVRPNFL